MSVSTFHWTPDGVGLTGLDADVLELVRAGGRVIGLETIAANQPNAATAGRIGPKPNVTRDAAELQQVLDVTHNLTSSHQQVCAKSKKYSKTEDAVEDVSCTN